MPLRIYSKQHPANRRGGATGLGMSNNAAYYVTLGAEPCFAIWRFQTFTMAESEQFFEGVVG
jgi:hypothetical protein